MTSLYFHYCIFITVFSSLYLHQGILSRALHFWRVARRFQDTPFEQVPGHFKVFNAYFSAVEDFQGSGFRGLGLHPRCAGRLLNDGEFIYPLGATGETWRCEHCDYSIDIVDE